MSHSQLDNHICKINLSALQQCSFNAIKILLIFITLCFSYKALEKIKKQFELFLNQHLYMYGSRSIPFQSLLNAKILNISKTAVHKNKVKLQTIKLQTGRKQKQLSSSRDDRQLFRISPNNCRMTKWPTKGMANSSWGEIQWEDGSKQAPRAKLQQSAGKKTKDWPFTDVWKFQLRPGEAYKLPTVKSIGGLMIICFSKAGIRHIHLCEGHMNQATYKVVLEENLPLTAQRIGVSSSTMLHATRPGQKSCGWRTTRSRPCHGQPNLQTWTPFSQPTAMSKTGRDHAKMHESCKNRIEKFLE